MTAFKKWITYPGEDVKDGDFIIEIPSGRFAIHESFGVDTGMSTIRYLDGTTDTSDWFVKARPMMVRFPRPGDKVWTEYGEATFLKNKRTSLLDKVRSLVEFPDGRREILQKRDAIILLGPLSEEAVKILSPDKQVNMNKLMFCNLDGDFSIKIKTRTGEFV